MLPGHKEWPLLVPGPARVSPLPPGPGMTAPPPDSPDAHTLPPPMLESHAAIVLISCCLKSPLCWPLQGPLPPRTPGSCLSCHWCVLDAFSRCSIVGATW